MRKQANGLFRRALAWFFLAENRLSVLQRLALILLIAFASAIIGDIVGIAGVVAGGLWH